MSKKIEKNFPADTTVKNPTFLNDPKINGELYAYLLSISIGEEGETRTYKSSVPSQKELAEILAPDPEHPLTRQTISKHLQYLILTGYIKDMGKYYIFPMLEKMYFKVPLDTLNYLLDTVKSGVIKTYIYLGQRNNYQPNQYVFTIKEICEHLGLSYTKQSNRVSNWLSLLQEANFIKIVSFYDGSYPKYRLVSFTTDTPKLPKQEEC